jgi:ADP-ribosylglycohydrolase
MIDAKVQGALLGLAVGDALGTTLEFSSPTELPDFPEFAAGPHREMAGGGPFRLAPGQVTDDTHMACCLAASLRLHGRFVAEDVLARYRAWADITFDIGGTTRDGLLKGGRRAWEASGRGAAGNGSLMRTAPIGALLASDPGAVLAASLADSALTHFDPRCQLACAALNAAVAFAVTEAAADPLTMTKAAWDVLPAAARALAMADPRIGDVVDLAFDDLREDLEAVLRPDPDLYQRSPIGLRITGHGQGFVRVAFRLAFWELVHAPTFEVALVDVVNRGGDADTNGAITGALLGARDGRDGLPSRWTDAVLGLESAELGNPFSGAYHPRRLLDLA